jgi:hypothetical protein
VSVKSRDNVPLRITVQIIRSDISKNSYKMQVITRGTEAKVKVYRIKHKNNKLVKRI